MNEYQFAKEKYASTGIDTENAISRLSGVRISMHCWQGDDVRGFENKASLTGGIEATGNYPGAACTPDELMSDLDKAFSLIPGRHRLNLHSTYALTGGREVGRDKLTYDDFAAWVDYAADRGIYLDMNPTLFSHPLAASGLTLSSPDEYVREFWIRHCKAVREIGAKIGEKQGSPCLNNIWIPDGYKETPADRLHPRLRLKESLDDIYKVKYDPSFLLDSVESKLFGIGVESYTVGSHEFYMNYAAKNGVMCLLDNGHFHPTENISDKISSMLVFSDKVALHISRGVRWDSDHVVTFTPELCEISKEIVAADALDRVIIALDYFDASINRVAAWVIGMRNMQKALLFALLTPHDQLRKFQDQGDFTSMLATEEEIKFYPYAAVWDESAAGTTYLKVVPG